MYLLVLQALRSYWPAVLFGLLLLRILYRRYLHPLHAVPGPFLASVTSLWFLRIYLTDKQQHLKPLELFTKYGPIVRIRPNTVIVNDPNHFAELLSWPKSEFFVAFRAHPTVIPHGNASTVSEHNQKKKNLMGGFTMSRVLQNESSMDRRVTEFLDQIATHCDDATFDLAPWTQFATFDVAMEMIFSNPVGFLKAGRDVSGIIGSLHHFLMFASVLGLYPWIAKIILSPRVFSIIGPKPTDKIGPGAWQGFAFEQVEKRLGRKDLDSEHSDILDWILNHPDKNGDYMSTEMIKQEMMGVAAAASDTTAGALRSIILGVASSPRIYTKLMQQIDSADAQGLLSTPPKWEEIQKHIPYMESLFKESQRVFPIVGFPLFKQLPVGGAHVSGYFLPEGTEAGIAQWAVGHDPRIHGNDAGLFRPERWSDDLSHDPVAAKRRNQSEIWFSGAPFLCTGRNIAMLEVYKITTQFFRRFNAEIVNVARPWTSVNELAVVHSDFFVKLTERKQANGVAS